MQHHGQVRGPPAHFARAAHGLYELYLRRHDRIDQWDLVDLAARDVVGGHLLERDRGPLVQKALGRVLRAAGDIDRDRLAAVVERHAASMPRVALRASIEHFSKEARARFLAIR